MITSLYMRPDEFWHRGGSVATTVGTTDGDYLDEWLIDDRPSRPARATSGTVTWSISAPSGSIDVVVIANHNIEGGRTITLGGGLSATVAAPASRQNGIPYNAFKRLASRATGVTGFTVGIASNPTAVVIGEVIAGIARELPSGGFTAESVGGGNTLRSRPLSEFMPSYDPASASRPWRASGVATFTELDEIMAWFEAQRNESRCSVLIPDVSVNDARVGYLQEPEWQARGGDVVDVQLNFREIPRVRW